MSTIHIHIVNFLTFPAVWYTAVRMNTDKEKSPRRLSVRIAPFAGRHYIKKFQKRYREKVWNVTREALLELCAGMLCIPSSRDIVDSIARKETRCIYKVKFRIPQSHESSKQSGNRSIVYVNEATSDAVILLVYHKNDLSSRNETQAWKSLIRDNLPEYRDLL